MFVVEILKKAREIINSERAWTKRSYIGDRTDGSQCYCAFAALQTAAISLGATNNGGPGFEADCAVRDALDPAFRRSIVTFNDSESTGHADILALFDRAIAALETRP